jgi:prepilin-type N-terminal cleavage/methylation domain-containing protein
MKQSGHIQAAAARGFTLIELLTTISIIAVLAALLIPVLGSLQKKKFIAAATAELGQVSAAIDSYHASYGSYPPSGTNVLLNPLYYELTGVSIVSTNGGQPQFQTLDGFSALYAADVQKAFGVGGLVNCTKGSGEDTVPAKNFLPGLKNSRYAVMTNSLNDPYYVLVTSVADPDPNYNPVPNAPGVNPFRYNSANPTNNPNSYDLWIDLSLGQKTNRISNWSQQVQVLP